MFFFWPICATNAYDAAGRLTSSTIDMDGTARTWSHQLDGDGNVTLLTGDAGYQAAFSYDGLDRMTEYQSVFQIGYDAAGRRAGIDMGPGMTSWTSWRYDPAGRLQTQAHGLADPAASQSVTFGYNPASQVVSEARTNDAYASTSAIDTARTYRVNGLNQYSDVAGNSYAYDLNGNLTSDGINSYAYDAENRLVSRSGGVALSYDPLGRLWQVSGPSTLSRFLYDGDRLVQEYDGAGNATSGYVHGPGADEPLTWYSAAGRRHLHADHQGSITAIADDAGNKVQINGYDPWGVPNAGNIGRFGYTGQVWLPELRMWYYKARIYSPMLGRFLQPDPIGYKDQNNLYAYVGNDPVDHNDPTGKESCGGTPAQCAAYREALNFAGKTAESKALTSSERRAVREEIASIKADSTYVILFAPQKDIDTVTRGAGFAFTNETDKGAIYTVLPSDFGNLYTKNNVTSPLAERAGVVGHEGSHRGDFKSGAIKRGDHFSRNSPTERKADKIQDSIVRGGQSVCTGTKLCQ